MIVDTCCQRITKLFYTRLEFWDSTTPLLLAPVEGLSALWTPYHVGVIYYGN